MWFIKTLIISLFLTSNSFGQKLPEFMTKQALENIRFITLDGKYTYYQRDSGSLNLSTNFSASEVLSFDANTEYTMYASTARKKIAIEVNKTFHNNFSFVKDNEIYTITFGDDKPQKVAEGIFPKLHIDDNFISFYRPQERFVVFKNLLANKEYRVSINKTKNPYFIPLMEMINRDFAIYSDITNEGYSAIFSISLLDNSTKPVYSSTKKAMKLEACLTESDLYLGEFPLYDAEGGSTIYKIPLYKNKDFEKKDIIYSTGASDLGSLICTEEALYFIKTTKNDKDIFSKITEAAKLDFKTKELKTLTSLRRVQSLINMDGRILVPYLKKYYVIKGESDLKTQELQGEKAK